MRDSCAFRFCVLLVIIWGALASMAPQQDADRAPISPVCRTCHAAVFLLVWQYKNAWRSGLRTTITRRSRRFVVRATPHRLTFDLVFADQLRRAAALRAANDVTRRALSLSHASACALRALAVSAQSRAMRPPHRL